MNNEQNSSDAKAHPVDTLVMLEVWNHGFEGEPCGETDIATISGKGIWLDVAEKLCNKTGYAFDWFGHLPINKWLIVEAKIFYDDGDPYFEVESYSEKHD